MEKTFLFSVDLEDVRERFEGGMRYAPRVPLMVARYLAFLDKHGFKATFFTVGQTAEANPDVIRSIVGAGHEIALHSMYHTPVADLGKERFRDDVAKNIEVLTKLGAPAIKGFRAPCLSMTKDTAWAYEAMGQCGLTYSSSVLPANSPLYGWPDHGGGIKEHGGVTELPVTILRMPNVPCAAGIYFRTLPRVLIKRGFDAAAHNGQAVVGYFHPYDIDEGQERFMHPDLNGNPFFSPFFNFLMYYNRGSVFPKLEVLIAQGWRIMRYDEFLGQRITHAHD